MSVEYVFLFVGRAHFVIVIFLSIVNERKERERRASVSCPWIIRDSYEND